MAFTYSAASISPSGYQMGIGGSYSTASPYDLYTGLGGLAVGTVTPQTSTLVLNGGSTITSATVQFPSNAAEGQRLRIISNQTLTTLTLTAGTNVLGATDTINGGVAALVANTAVEYAYKLAPATNAAGGTANAYTWYRVQ